MTASGLVTTDSSTDNNHVLAVVEFAFAIRSQLQVVNVHSFNNFQLRIGPFQFICYSLNFERFTLARYGELCRRCYAGHGQT